jgi:nitrate reductase gamma subunit
MRKLIVLVVLVFLSVPIFSLVVPSDELTSKYGISYAERQKSDYIEKGGYSFQYLGNGTWDAKQLSQTANSQTSNSGKTDDSTRLMVVLLVVVGVIIVIGVCVSNITTAVAKNAGMDEKSAKKVGASAGVLAGTAAAIGAAVLLGKSGGRKPDPNHITITHKH